MKIRPLPDLDLARIAPLASSEKRNALRAMKVSWSPYSYGPMRSSLLDLLNIDPGPLASGSSTPWSKIADAISKKAKTSDEQAANLAVAKSLFDFSVERGVYGRRHEIFPLLVGTSRKVSYWHSFVIGLEGAPVVPFVDPRRAKRLTVAARQFVFSVMHERIRVADPDFAAVRLAIIQFQDDGQGVRKPRLYFDSEESLFTFHDLQDMIEETYSIWIEVLEEREADVRRRGTGTSGPLI